MNQKTIFYLSSLLIFIFFGCSSNNRQDRDNLPFIDVRKNYPEKEIILTDIADISYVHLCSTDDDYLFTVMMIDYFITNNTIVVYDVSSSSILFFSKDGKPKSRFNRLGQGPQEYFNLSSFFYDEERDDVFVRSRGERHLQVYSSKGEYKRKINLPLQKQFKVNSMISAKQVITYRSFISFDDQTFLMFTDISPATEIERKEYYIPPYTSFYHISKKDGSVLDSFYLFNKDVDLVEYEPGSRSYAFTSYKRAVKSIDGFYLYNPETDTVFFYSKEKILTPVFHKTPLVSDLDPKVIINNNILDSYKYHFFSIEKIAYSTKLSPNPPQYFFHDKETNEIFRQKITLPDYLGKEFKITGRHANEEDGSGFHVVLTLIELKQAYNENRLSGKLKELVATLDELEDNDVLMLAKFK